MCDFVPLDGGAVVLDRVQEVDLHRIEVRLAAVGQAYGPGVIERARALAYHAVLFANCRVDRDWAVLRLGLARRALRAATSSEAEGDNEHDHAQDFAVAHSAFSLEDVDMGGMFLVKLHDSNYAVKS